MAFPKSEPHYGLALPLGGAEVTMEELAELYALLASDGVPKKIDDELWAQDFRLGDCETFAVRGTLSPG